MVGGGTPKPGRLGYGSTVGAGAAIIGPPMQENPAFIGAYVIAGMLA